MKEGNCGSILQNMLTFKTMENNMRMQNLNYGFCFFLLSFFSLLTWTFFSSCNAL